MSELERIVTEVPGPRSRDLARRLARTESRNVTFFSEDSPAFWDRASGATVTDVDGNRYLDLTSAFGVATTGHANAAVSAAMTAQAARLPHAMGDVHPAEIKARLLDELIALAPMQPAKAFLCTSGADSVDFALKTALLATGRPNALSFEPSYHGLSSAALEVTGMPRFREPFAVQLRNATTFVAYPDRREPGALERVLGQVRDALSADRSIGAVIVEPIAGRAGVVVPPGGFLGGLRRLCDEHACLLIADEIYTGFWRTGTLFATMRDDVAPDILCVGKALGGGFPVAAAIARADVMDAWPASAGEALHTSTYLGNPMGCAAALANLAEMTRLRAGDCARALESRLRRGLEPLGDRPWVRDVRGRGALWGVECDDGSRANAWVTAALRGGVIVLQSGLRGETLAISPPLVIDEPQLARALELLHASAPA